jgi:hypothetical protein
VVQSVLGPSGQALAVRPGLIAPEAGALTLAPAETLWLEYQEPGRFRLAVEPAPPLADTPDLKAEPGVSLEFDPEDAGLLRPATGHRATLAGFELARRAAQLATHAGFDRLICLPLVRDMELLRVVSCNQRA